MDATYGWLVTNNSLAILSTCNNDKKQRPRTLQIKIVPLSSNAFINIPDYLMHIYAWRDSCLGYNLHHACVHITMPFYTTMFAS